MKKEVFITPEKFKWKVLRYLWWCFFTICAGMVIYEVVILGESPHEFNFGGMPLN
jgi:hypothetical protein